jgi:hypothetical protein
VGTNYYVVKNKCECCKRFDEEYHIGKSSVGWAFSFQGYKWNKLTSWSAWKEFLKSQSIVDEYGEEMKYNDFCEMVEIYKAPGFIRDNGHTNLVHNTEGRKDGYFDPEYDWDDENGYSFCSRDFS